MTTPMIADYDAIVIGAGFSGIRSLWELRKLGLTAKAFEAGSDVGGAWYWNKYPGARTDSEAWVYAMNFTPGMADMWNYSERYPSQQEVQSYLSKIVDKFDLRKLFEFNTRIVAAHYSDRENIWTITAASGATTTSRYFLAASGPLTIAKTPPYAGLKSYTGVWYQTSSWPSEPVDFHGKRVAVIGTGATGVQIIPKLARVSKELTVFQRTPNYVLPGRNYSIDEGQAAEIRQDYDATWKQASTHPSGLVMTPAGSTSETVADVDRTKQLFDAGWETGGFHFQFETLDDLFTNPASNEIASDYIRQKISAIVRDPETAKVLSPKYPFLAKRPPCGHFYYEAYNRPNVRLVDISRDDIEIFERGIRTSSGVEYEVDIIIFALGFDAATGALNEIDVRGSQGKSLKQIWAKKVETFAGALVPGFPNMFLVCGPHIPFGNMPVVLDIGVRWIGKTIEYMEKNKVATINVSQAGVDSWSSHLDDAFEVTLFAESAKKSGSWFVGANIPGKPVSPLFYFGGIQKWSAWLDNAANTALLFSHLEGTDQLDEQASIGSCIMRATEIKSTV